MAASVSVDGERGDARCMNQPTAQSVTAGSAAGKLLDRLATLDPKTRITL